MYKQFYQEIQKLIEGKKSLEIYVNFSFERKEDSKFIR